MAKIDSLKGNAGALRVEKKETIGFNIRIATSTYNRIVEFFNGDVCTKNTITDLFIDATIREIERVERENATRKKINRLLNMIANQKRAGAAVLLADILKEVDQR